MRTRLLCALALLISLGRFSAPPTQAAGAPAGLPAHFGIGLMAGPDNNGIYGWMPNSGIPWDYAYQYLSAGVNTGNGWETWNTSGQFPLYYAQGAASHGYIPVFSYYELLQSNGSCGSCGEQQKDLSNLNTPSLMASYFQNFRLLMQRLGSGTYGGITGYGGTAIVQVEPDLSGYAEQAVLNNGSCYGYCTAQGNNPSYLKASVASSGDADVQGYPNTYQGFNWALLHLRDLYAPRVLLAFHVSDWATRQDIGSSTDPSLNAASLGQEAGSFAAQSGTVTVPAGTSTYDLLFNDIADRDAPVSGIWWDRNNVTFPNFHRWESYVSGASGAAGKSVIVWQIPEGNQYFDTDNNSPGHYQDNYAEYFFGHIPELAQNGIIGLLFGPGNGGTSHTDATGDGVTNPASICTSNGLSSGQICNNHQSTVSDDDGGYIRMEGQQYFANPYPLSGSYARATIATPSGQPSSFTPGSTVTYSVTVTNTGTTTWSASGTNPVHLGIHFANKGGGFPTSYSSGWLTDQRYALPSNVAPGQSVTLTVSVTPPSVAGTDVLEYQMVEEGVAWFPSYLDSSVTVTAPPLAASYAPSGQPSSMTHGTSVTYSIALKNTGTQSWQAGGTTPVHLGIHFASKGGGYPTSWGTSGWLTDQRFALPSTVAPGSSVTISVTVTAPSTTGSYVLEDQMVEEGIAWFPSFLDSSVSVT